MNTITYKWPQFDMNTIHTPKILAMLMRNIP